MANSFNCPNCGQKLTAKTEMAGVIIDCPSCGSQIQVPAFEAPVPMAPQPTAYPPAAIPQRFQDPYGQQPVYPHQQPYAPQQPYPPQQPYAPQMQPIPQPYGQQPAYGYQQPQFDAGMAQGKDWLTTLLLCLFLGGLGVHNFYVGKTNVGVLQLVLFFLFGISWIWALVDLITIITGKFTDAEGRPLVRK